MAVEIGLIVSMLSGGSVDFLTLRDGSATGFSSGTVSPWRLGQLLQRVLWPRRPGADVCFWHLADLGKG